MRGFALIFQITIATMLLSPQWTSTAQDRATLDSARDERVRIVEHCPVIVVDALVVSRTMGRPVDDLTYRDFLILENGSMQSIALMEYSNMPVSLVLLIDSFDANNDCCIFSERIRALKSLIAHLRDEDEASVIAIAHPPIILQDFTSDKTLITGALDSASRYKIAKNDHLGERLSDALEQSAHVARKHSSPKARNAIILLSNSLDARLDSTAVREKTVRAIIESGTIFYASGSAYRFDPPDLGEVAFDNISVSDLVWVTGGEFLGGDWTSFVERLSTRYRIGYVSLPPNGTRRGELARIKLNVRPNSNHDPDDFVLHYRRAAVIPQSR